MQNEIFDVIVIGGGQAGLACGYYLSKTKLNYLIIDKYQTEGGAWQYTWDSLKLFSPSNHSSLPGWFMPKSNEEYPTKTEVIKYLKDYASKFKLKIQNGLDVKNVDYNSINQIYKLTINNINNQSIEYYNTKVIINATGTFESPFIPEIKNLEKFNGEIIHSANYNNPLNYLGKKVLIVGGGNSGAQILAEVSIVTETKWSTLKQTNFLPDDIDGRDLFHFASAAYQKGDKKSDFCGVSSLGDIVMLDSVKDARKRGVLVSNGKIAEFTSKGVIWENNKFEEEFDVVIFCTGFKSNLIHLDSLIDNSKVKLKERDFNTEPIFESLNYPNLFFVGYGNWTGYASATLIGVGRYAKSVVGYINTIILNTIQDISNNKQLELK